MITQKSLDKRGNKTNKKERKEEELVEDIVHRIKYEGDVVCVGLKLCTLQCVMIRCEFREVNRNIFPFL